LPVEKLTICGGFGKITKLAKGHLDLHSRASSIDLEHLSSIALQEGASSMVKTQIVQANTSVEALNICQKNHIQLGNAVCQAALEKARRIVPSSVNLEIFAIDRDGRFVGSAGCEMS